MAGAEGPLERRAAPGRARRGASPPPAAKALYFTSFDGADTESLTFEQAGRDDVIVALQMLGAPVTHEHGGPVRLYVAPMFGYKSLKWLSGIQFTSEVVAGFWENNGYPVDAFFEDCRRERAEPSDGVGTSDAPPEVHARGALGPPQPRPAHGCVLGDRGDAVDAVR